MENEQMQPEQEGRGGDDTIGHLTHGEVVIPVALMQDPQVMEMLQALFQQGGIDIAEYTVGDPANKINPETGYPEFFLSGIRHAVSHALSHIAHTAIDGTGIHGLRKAAASATNLDPTGLLPHSLVQTAQQVAPIALNFIPGIGPLIAAGYTAANSYGQGGSLLGSVGKGALSYGIGRALSGAGSAIGGTAAGTPLADGAQGPTLGSGIRGLASGGSSGIGGALSGASSAAGGSTSYLPLAASILGGVGEDSSIKKQREQLLAANKTQQANLNSFDPSGITSDPGYQFNLQQGQEGLNKGLAANGQLQSGAALKAASQYNQNYAQNAFNDYYQRWLTKVNGQNALTGAAGDVRANATGAKSQNLAQSLSNAVGSPVGQYGQGLTLDQLRKLGMAV